MFGIPRGVSQNGGPCWFVLKGKQENQFENTRRDRARPGPRHTARRLQGRREGVEHTYVGRMVITCAYMHIHRSS